MSINFDTTLAKVGSVEVKINTSGFDNKILTEDTIKLNIYAYDVFTGKPVFTSSMGIDEIRTLYSYLSNFSIVKDKLPRSFTFKELTSEMKSLIDEIEKVDPSLLRKLLDKMKSDEKIATLISSLSDDELVHLEATRKQTQYHSELQNLKKMIEMEIGDQKEFVKNISIDEILSKYRAGQPEKIFQNWVEQNLWIFGGVYYKKHEARKIGLNTESDLIIENLEGFIDLIELKRPSAIIFGYDKGHKSFYPSLELSKVLGQSLQYLKKLDEYKAILENEYKVKVLTPRIIVIIGSTKGEFSDEMSDLKFETLRMLNSNLNHVNIMSYDQIYNMGQNIVKNYESITDQ